MEEELEFVVGGRGTSEEFEESNQVRIRVSDPQEEIVNIAKHVPIKRGRPFKLKSQSDTIRPVEQLATINREIGRQAQIRSGELSTIPKRGPGRPPRFRTPQQL